MTGYQSTLIASNLEKEYWGGRAEMAVPTENLSVRERSRAQIAIVLFMLLLVVLFVELFSTPYVVTVYSKGCWSVNTDGVFNHFNMRGCGKQSWLFVDLYARVTTPSVSNGATDLSVFLTEGAGPGGGCFGGSACGFNSLWSLTPPSPVACSGCVVTQLGLNPFADLGSGLGGSLGSFPFFTWLLLLYLAGKILDTRRVYSEFLKGDRVSLGWKGLSDRRKTLATFALGFLAIGTYQYIATWVYLFFRPVPIPNLLAFVGFLVFPVAIWLARFPKWNFPLKSISSPTVVSSEETHNETTIPMSTSPSIEHSLGRRSRKPVFLGIVLIVALVTGTVIGPPLYSYTAAALAPRSNLQVIASPSTFTATPGAIGSTTILVKSLRGPTAHVTLTVNQTPSCNGACTVPLLGVNLSQNSFNLSPDQSAASSFDVKPEIWADPGSYDFIVTASPDQGVAASTIVTVHLAGFNMTASPPLLSFQRTYSAQSIITLSSVYNYAGLVSFYAYPDPCRWPTCQNGPVVSLSAKNVTLQSGATASVTLTVTSLAQGNYSVVLTAASGPIFRDVTIPTATTPTSFNADFSLTVNPTNANVRAGQKQLVTVNVSSLNGCICIIHLALQGNTSYSYGPLDLYVDPTQNANATLTVSTGIYPSIETITVTATSGNLAHTVEIILRVT